MQEDKGENMSLYIPVNIRKRKEVIDGIGGKEIRKIVLAIILGIIMGILMYCLKCKNPIMLFTPPVIIGSGAAILFRKNSMNRNFFDNLAIFIEYVKSQKRFYYKYSNIYERRKENEK